MKTKPQVDEDEPRFDVSKGRLIRRGPREGLRIGLSALRGSRDLTQDEVAARAGVDQAEISRLETRGDCLVSTLERYVKALGGTLRLVVELDGRTYPIGLSPKILVK